MNACKPSLIGMAMVLTLGGCNTKETPSSGRSAGDSLAAFYGQDFAWTVVYEDSPSGLVDNEALYVPDHSGNRLMSYLPVRTPSHLFHDWQPMAGGLANGYSDVSFASVVDSTIAQNGAPTATRYAQEGIILLGWLQIDSLDANGNGNGNFKRGRLCFYGQIKGPLVSNPGDVEFVAHGYKKPKTSCPHKPNSTTLIPYAITKAPNGYKIPNAARLDVTAGGSIILGVPCFEGYWCELGGKSSTTGIGGNAKRTVKGWFDEQYLATIYQGKPKRSDLYAVLYPQDTLENVNTVSKYDQDWVNVATIHIPAVGPNNAPQNPTGDVLERYRVKWRLPNAPVPGDSIRIDMIHDPAQDSIHGWRAKYVRFIQGGGVEEGGYIKVPYHPDSGALPGYIPTVPGTARWGWSPKDETSWVRCAAGCCEVGSADTANVKWRRLK